MQYCGGVQYHGGFTMHVGGYLEYCGDIMIHVGDTMSTMRGVQYCGGTRITKDVLMISPHMHHDIPYGTEHPRGTQDIPHMHHDITPQY